jgi:hypothetical protein
MRLRRLAALAAVLHVFAGNAPADTLFNGAPAITVSPDEYPVDAYFFFPAGGPLERFTGRPGAWYAIFRSPMYPGRPYDLILVHNGDPGRMKVFALDNHPFDKVSVKSELPLRKIDGWADSSDSAYAATILLPRDASVHGIYLLLEWMPPPGKERPLPVSMQVLSPDPRWQMGQGRNWSFPAADQRVKSPLQRKTGVPHEIPVPRRDIRERGAGEWIEEERGK